MRNPHLLVIYTAQGRIQGGTGLAKLPPNDLHPLMIFASSAECDIRIVGELCTVKVGPTRGEYFFSIVPPF